MNVKELVVVPCVGVTAVSVPLLDDGNVLCDASDAVSAPASLLEM